MLGPTAAEKRRRTQWAAQFLTAAELTRRGYTVSFTTGNTTPVADLMVGTTSGELFWVDVKGLASRTPWFYKPKAARDKLFYILVLLSPTLETGPSRPADRFFVLTQAQGNFLEEEYRSTRPKIKNTAPGFYFDAVLPYEGAWSSLPT